MTGWYPKLVSVVAVLLLSAPVFAEWAPHSGSGKPVFGTGHNVKSPASPATHPMGVQSEIVTEGAFVVQPSARPPTGMGHNIGRPGHFYAGDCRDLMRLAVSGGN